MNIYVKSIETNDEFAEIPELRAEVVFAEDENTPLPSVITVWLELPKADELTFAQLKATAIAEAKARLNEAAASE